MKFGVSLNRFSRKTKGSVAASLAGTLVLALSVSLPNAQAAPTPGPVWNPCSFEHTNIGSRNIIQFKNVGDCDYTIPAGVTSVDVMVVAGGGGGGAVYGGGGSGGQVLKANAVPVTPGTSIVVTVGAGGLSGLNQAPYSAGYRHNGTVGGNSYFDQLEAVGGGYGATPSMSVTPGDGGAYGGGGATAGVSNPGATGSLGRHGGASAPERFNTSNSSDCCGGAGGGGGAGANGGDGVGLVGGAGGAGVDDSVPGATGTYFTGATPTFFGGGGGGGATNLVSSGTNGVGGAGGLGGGGAGGSGSNPDSPAVDGAANTGGGGGGGGGNYPGASSGGSGIVVLNYVDPPCAPTSTAGSTPNTTIYAFTNVGGCSWSIPAGATVMEGLLVGGGGAGGPGSGNYGGGGGSGGEVFQGQWNVTGGTSTTIKIGAGGTAGNGDGPDGTNGEPTTVSFGSTTKTVAGGGIGGGYVGMVTDVSNASTGNASAYGGGAWPGYQQAGTIVSGAVGSVANHGGASSTTSGGGGGGAGGIGQDAIADAGGGGGSGIASTLSGVNDFYGGGGGGGGVNNSGPGATNAGIGCGPDAGSATSGTANTGGGGGGGCPMSWGAGNGGSGVVYLMVTVPPAIGVPTISSTVGVGGNVITDVLNSTNTRVHATITIPGTTPANSIVKLYFGNTLLGQATVSTLGTTSVTVDSTSTTTSGLQTAIPAPTSGTTRDLSATITTSGTEGSRSANYPVVVDYTAPVVNSITTTTTAGSFKAGTSIAMSAVLSDATTAGKSFVLTLNNGKTVTLTAAAAGTTLSGTYLVASGDDTAALTGGKLVVSSINATSSGITDSNGNSLASAPTVPTGLNQFGGAVIVIDTIAPTLTWDTASSTVGPSSTSSFVVTLSDSSTLTTGMFTPSGGSITSVAAVTTNPGTSWRVNYAAPASGSVTISFNAAALTDAAGNTSVAAVKTISISTAATPTIAGTVITGGTVIANVGSASTLNGTNTKIVVTVTTPANTTTNSTLKLYLGTSQLGSSITGVGANSTKSFTIGATSGTSALQTAITAGGNLTATLTPPAGTESPASSAWALTVDYVAPTISASSAKSLVMGSDTSALTFTASESTTDFVTSDVTVTASGGAAVGTISGFAGSAASYTAVFNSGTSSGSNVVKVTAGSFTDAAGNPNAASSNVSITIDAVAPTVTSVSTTTAAGIYGVATSMPITITMSEAVTAGSVIRVRFNNGGFVDCTATVQGTTLVGAYSVIAGEDIAKLTVVTISVTSATDPAGNTATGNVPTGNNNLGNKNIVIDTIAPTLTKFTTTIVTGLYKASKSIPLTAVFSETVISGSQIIATLTNGATVTLKTTSASVNLTGTYVVAAGDDIATPLDVASFAITSVKDAANNSLAGTTLPTVSAGSLASTGFEITIDTVSPGITLAAGSTTLAKSGNTPITITLSEDSTNLLVGDFTISGGGSLSGFAGTGSLYSATYSAPNSNTATSLKLTAGNFTDAAGNTNLVSNTLNFTIGTGTSTATPTPSPSPSSSSKSPSPSASPTASPSPSPSETKTNSPSTKKSETSTPSPTPTPTASASKSPSATPSPSTTKGDKVNEIQSLLEECNNEKPRESCKNEAYKDLDDDIDTTIEENKKDKDEHDAKSNDGENDEKDKEKSKEDKERIDAAEHEKDTVKELEDGENHRDDTEREQLKLLTMLPPTTKLDKVTICHATKSGTNPYQILDVAPERITRDHQDHSDDIIPGVSGLTAKNMKEDASTFLNLCVPTSLIPNPLPSFTPIPTPAPSSSSSASATATPTASASSTQSASGTPLSSPSATALASHSATPSQSATQSSIASAEPSSASATPSTTSSSAAPSSTSASANPSASASSPTPSAPWTSAAPIPSISSITPNTPSASPSASSSDSASAAPVSSESVAPSVSPSSLAPSLLPTNSTSATSNATTIVASPSAVWNIPIVVDLIDEILLLEKEIYDQITVDIALEDDIIDANGPDMVLPSATPLPTASATGVFPSDSATPIATETSAGSSSPFPTPTDSGATNPTDNGSATPTESASASDSASPSATSVSAEPITSASTSDSATPTSSDIASPSASVASAGATPLPTDGATSTLDSQTPSTDASNSATPTDSASSGVIPSATSTSGALPTDAASLSISPNPSTTDSIKQTQMIWSGVLDPELLDPVLKQEIAVNQQTERELQVELQTKYDTIVQARDALVTEGYSQEIIDQVNVVLDRIEVDKQNLDNIQEKRVAAYLPYKNSNTLWGYAASLLGLWIFFIIAFRRRRVVVNNDLCSACGLCFAKQPEVFVPGVNGKALIRSSENSDKKLLAEIVSRKLTKQAKETAKECPVEAISTPRFVTREIRRQESRLNKD